MSEILGFDNFRIFDNEAVIDLKPITILTGPNSSGKSSVIKAAKLLKQNINSGRNTGFPIGLSYTPDDLGHNLGDYNQTINRYSNKEDLSFIIPIKLITLGDDFNCKFTYGKMEDSLYPEEITLKSISITYGKGTPISLISIKGSFGSFNEIEINPILIKSCFEETFLPLLGNKDNPKDSFAIAMAMMFKKELPGQDLLKELLTSDEMYVKDKPVMPWYKIITSENNSWFFVDENQSSKILSERYTKIAEYYKFQVEAYKEANSISSFMDATMKYFIMVENDFFKFISEKKLSFPIDLGIDSRDTTWWNGILLKDQYDQEIRTSENTIKAIFGYDSNLAELMDVCENSISLDNNKLENNEILTYFTQYVMLQSIEECRTYVDKFRFADLNRIEQVLLYTSTNSLTAFKIINDYKRNENIGTKKLINYYLRKLNIADEYNIISGNGAYQVDLFKQNRWVPLASLGFGISKLFFFLLTLSAYEMVFIEEPESNLHPDLQSRLADILLSFLSYPNHNKKVIIETHSEYFIRKLQYLVATNKLNKEDVIIYYFNPISDKTKNKPVKAIGIKRDGSLDGEFGKGFFDEASNIIRDLFNLTVYN